MIQGYNSVHPAQPYQQLLICFTAYFGSDEDQPTILGKSPWDITTFSCVLTIDLK